MPYGVLRAVGEFGGLIMSIGREPSGILYLKDRNMGCKIPDLLIPMLGSQATGAGIQAAKVKPDGLSLGDLNQRYAKRGIDVLRDCKRRTHDGSARIQGRRGRIVTRHITASELYNLKLFTRSRLESCVITGGNPSDWLVKATRNAVESEGRDKRSSSNREKRAATSGVVAGRAYKRSGSWWLFP
jgi:hypothetical protein